MGNTVKDYEDRIAGISPDEIRDYVHMNYNETWKGNVLDLGTGQGDWANILDASQKFSKITCCDLLDCRGEVAKKFDFFKTDLANEKIPLDDASLDFVFALEVIEHIENPRNFIREAFRVLKPGGNLILTTPSCDSIRARISFLLRGYFPAFNQSDYKGSGHITPITSYDLTNMKNEAGFKDISFNFGMRGRMPSSKLEWQTFFPFLKGKLWSDTLIAKLEK